jgi:outer membrane protein assembly factor BamB
MLVVVAGAIVLAGEVMAIGFALSGSSFEAAVLWLVGGVIAALAVVAYGSEQHGAARRTVEAAGASLVVFVLAQPLDGRTSGFAYAISMAAAAGAGTALALPGRAFTRLAARVVAVAAAAVVVLWLDTITASDLDEFLPGLVVAAVGIADVAVDTLGRGRLLLGTSLALGPAAVLVGGVVLNDRADERNLREQRLAAQPAPATVGRERIAWMFPARGFYSGPLVGENLVVADARDAVYGLDATTGTTRWRVLLRGREGLTQPVVDGDLLLYPTIAGLHAVDATSGRRRWRFAPGGVDMLGVVVHPDGVVAGGWDPPGITLYGLDRGTGRRRWQRFLRGDRLKLVPDPIGALVDTGAGRWRVDSRSGRATHVDTAPEPEYTYGNPAALRSRSRGWLYRAGWEAATSEPLELDGQVFVNIDLWPPKAAGGLYVLDAVTGELQWRVEIPGDSEFKPASRGELVYVTSTGACADLGGCRSGLYAIRRR